MSLEVDRPHHPGSHCFQVLLADAACTTLVSCVCHALSLQGVGQQHAVLLTTDTCANSSEPFSMCTSGVQDILLHEA